MLCAHRLAAVRICLLVLSVVLWSAAVSAFAGADPSRTVASFHAHRTVSSRAHERRTKCAAAARAGRHRKAGKSCAGRKSNASRTKRSVSRKRPAPLDGGAPPANVFEASSSPPAKPVARFRFFSPTSFWNEALSAGAPLDSSSSAVVGVFDEEIAAAEVAKKGQATINTTAWSTPIYTVPADQPVVKVTLYYGVSAALQAAWSAVPLPANAQPAAGSDKNLVVWQPSTDRMWEFWGLEQTGEGWQAAWGGAMKDVSTNKGVYGAEAWQGAATLWGASASSLPIAGGLVTLEDLEKGQINHALAIGVPAVREGVYASPAQRTDGKSTSPLSLPEGAHLRLDPNLDLASLHLPKLTLMLAEAAQRYGIFVRDKASNVAFYGQDPTPTGTNPYAGTHGYYEGKSPQQLLESFPWKYLQLLKMELHNES
jgi:hypothetical protein